MSKFENAMYRIAGIDEDTINKSPETDKIYARHLGIALSFTFLLIFLISFYSLSYIGKGAMEFDVETNSFVSINASSIFVYTGSLVVAFIIAFVIILFDRTLFMADWFSKKPFGFQLGLIESLVNKMSIAFRITIRILISITVAYALSIFLELKVFESEIVRKMTDKHLSENKASYDFLAKFHTDLYKSLEKKKERLYILQDEYTELMKSNKKNGIPTKRIDDINKEINRISTNSKNEIEKTNNSYVALLTPLYKELKSININVVDTNKKILSAKKRKAAEETGENPEGFNNVSENKGTGDKYDYWELNIKGYNEYLMGLKDSLKPINIRISQLEEEKKSLVKSIFDNSTMTVNNLINQKNDIYKAVSDSDNSNDESYRKILSSYKESLNALESEIFNEELTLDKKYKKEKNRVFSEPSYKPLVDGPLSRLTALNVLKNPEDGIVTAESKTINGFSLLLKFIVVFLEVAPVISKMIFSPPTGYSYRVQGLVIRDVLNEKWERDLSLKVLDKENELDIKKSIIEIESELARLKHRQRFNEAFSHAADEEFSKVANE